MFPDLPWATDDDVKRIEALQGLRKVVTKERALARERDELVRQARESGATWTLIAKSLGVTQQAVSARYASAEKPGQRAARRADG